MIEIKSIHGILYLNKCILAIITIIMISCEQPIRSQFSMEVEIMGIVEIKWYDNYIVSNGTIYGINGNELEKVLLIDNEKKEYSFKSFFKKSGKIYFSAMVDDKECFYEQSINVLKEIDSMPKEPESIRIEASLPPYKIDRGMYEELEISTVYRDTLQEAYIIIDGAIKVDEGLWFSVPESYKTRYEGVYFWPLVGSKSRILDQGKIW